jgi:D-beta-D-heptose 7-phosphate kinase/D-beta-D-heptose 1-phosphate adenosyltransferase
MNHDRSSLLDRFRDVRVLVLGEAMLDCYLDGASTRLCREAPVPIVDVATRVDTPGGAANTALNLAALGASTKLISAVGDDREGDQVREALTAGGVDASCVLPAVGRNTLAKHRVMASSQLLVRFDQGDIAPIDGDAELTLINQLRAQFAEHDALVISDYGYGVITPGVLSAIGGLQRRTPRLIIVDSRDLPRFRGLRPAAVKPNYDEAMRLLGIERAATTDSRAAQVERHAERLLDITGAQLAAVTLDSDGAILAERGAPAYRTYATAQANSRAAGAGDTFVAALTAALAASGGTTDAAEIASAAASVVVAKPGTSACSARELRDALGSGSKVAADGEALASRVARLRADGKRIVFTNGCFDILHRGHVTYLNRAKTLGDVLVVGVNSDASVERLKGPSRPINSLDDRTQVLAAMSCVDVIATFAEDTPAELIRAVHPDVFVKGGDYTPETLPEAPLVRELGGRVELLPYLEERSTTAMIDRIRAAYERPRPDARRKGKEDGRQRPKLGRRTKPAVRPA